MNDLVFLLFRIMYVRNDASKMVIQYNSRQET